MSTDITPSLTTESLHCMSYERGLASFWNLDTWGDSSEERTQVQRGNIPVGERRMNLQLSCMVSNIADIGSIRILRTEWFHFENRQHIIKNERLYHL